MNKANENVQDGIGHVLLSIRIFDYNNIHDGNSDILLGGTGSSNDEDLASQNKGGSDAWFLKLDGLTGGNVTYRTIIGAAVLTQK